MLDDFIKAMHDAGIGPAHPDSIVADDTIHRYEVDGDRRGTKNGVYRLAADGDFGYGFFMSHKLGEVHKWHTKAKRSWTADEKKAHKERIEARRIEADRQRKMVADAATEEAQERWARASRDGTSQYLIDKGIDVKGVRYDGDELLVPMWRDGRMVSVQRIMPDGVKLFIKGSDHVGAYFSIKGDLSVIAICEGVATGSLVHRLTGWSVICAFNAGNLKSVAKTMRDKYQDARIVIAADNDHETASRRPELGNPGLDKAAQAAIAIGGAQVIAPPADAGVSDWDDYARAAGDDAARDALTAVAGVMPVSDPEPEPETWEPVSEPPSTRDDPFDEIRPMGHNRGEYYFFPRSTGQIMSFSATALSRAANLYQLAGRGFWLALYAPETSMGTIADYASAELIAECHRRGVFSIENVRGVGVWRDNGKYLVNCGDVIVGEGIRMHPSAYEGAAVYEAGPRVIDLDVEPLATRDAAEFRALCNMPTWKRAQFGDLLAGFCVISMVGSALKWRPHIAVSGQRGAGKSTVMDEIIKRALGDIAIKRDGGTTEAGVRKAIGMSGRPFVMDEAESEGQARLEMDKILFLIRRASSGSIVENANATYVIRSCFVLAAINPRIEQGADRARFTQLELMQNKRPDATEHYQRLLDKIDTVLTGDFPARLMARTVANLDVLIDNVKTFGDAIARMIGDKRSGDQLGPMIAGAYSLVSTKRVTMEFATDWINKQEWDWHEGGNDKTDAEALVEHILMSRVRYDQDGMGRESTIGDLVTKAAGNPDAAKGLGAYGIKVDGDRLVISNSSPGLRKVLDQTPWAVWRRTLSDYVGADNYGNKIVYFGSGLSSKAVSIPLASAVGDADGYASDDFDMEGF